jgi:hypothetical protein
MKPVKRVDLSALTTEQRAAFTQFYRDCQAAAPEMLGMQDAAQKLFTQWVRAPKWQPVEGETPDRPDQGLWHVKPEINYVDHIEGVS